MPAKRARAAARRSKFRRLLDGFGPASGVAVSLINEQLISFFRTAEAEGAEVMRFAADCLGPRPQSTAAAAEWDEVMAIAGQIAAPHLFPRTPGSVHRRQERGSGPPTGQSLKSQVSRLLAETGTQPPRTL